MTELSIFDAEKDIIKNSKTIVDDKQFNDNPLYEDYQKLAVHYEKLFHQFERMMKLAKYERYEKRRTKLHARLPDCMADSVAIGDRIQIAETRPISKTIHFMVSKIVKTAEVKGAKQ